jgi:DNA-directed RNA polymerase specialized sigma24 family protein
MSRSKLRREAIQRGEEMPTFIEKQKQGYTPEELWAIIEEYMPLVKKTASRYINSSGLRPEMIAELKEELPNIAVESLFRSLPNFDSSKGKLSVYIVIVCNTAFNQAVRSRLGQRAVAPKGHYPDLPLNLITSLDGLQGEDGEIHASVSTLHGTAPKGDAPNFGSWEKLMHTLSARQEQVVRLHLQEGWNYSEIARAIGVTPGTVWTAYHKAILKLRKVHDEEAEEGRTWERPGDGQQGQEVDGQAQEEQSGR